MQTTIRHARFEIPNNTEPSQATTWIDLISSRVEAERKRSVVLNFPTFVRAAAELLNKPPAENDKELVRQGLSDWAISAAFSSVVGQAFYDGFRLTPDSLQGVYDIQAVENFLPQMALSQYQGGRLTVASRGRAESLFYGLGGQPWAISRFTAQAAIDEIDLVNVRALDTLVEGAKEMGRAAKRLIADTLWALVFSNPLMPDDVVCFDAATHGNYAAAAFSDTALDSAFAALGRQTLTDDEGLPLHVNASGRYLIVSPAIFGPAQRQSHCLWAGLTPIEVRSESRLTTLGFLHPTAEQIVTAPTDSSWLLAAPASTIKCLVLGALDGKVEPEIRITPFGQTPPGGRWGYTLDCKLDIGAALVNYRGLYFSAGA